MILQKDSPSVRGEITLDGSKSISNRAALILALCGEMPEKWLKGVSTSRDTTTLLRLLRQENDANIYDAGDAGTVFRFMTAYLATKPGVQTLTGSARMLERPVGPLVSGLEALGAPIRWMGRAGYPPIEIGYVEDLGRGKRRLEIDGQISSQFISALLMVGPCLPEGLLLIPNGELVSKPYIEMTLSLMRHFGAKAIWTDQGISVEPGGYTPWPLTVEADWSAASYWYAIAAISEAAHITLYGLHTESWQGDAALVQIMRQFGVETRFFEGGCVLEKTTAFTAPAFFEYDFVRCPDIAQTLAATCAALGTQGLFTGLQTLAIKETDRVKAMHQELSKVGGSMIKLPPRFSKKNPEQTYYMVGGPTQWEERPVFATHGDHRMAMSLAPMALLGEIEIENPEVVAKSYPQFWDHLTLSGFSIR